MQRKFEFGSDDWYNTIEYIFANDDNSTSLSQNEIVDIFKNYYVKFKKGTKRKMCSILSSNYSFFSNSLADMLYNCEGARVCYEQYMSKGELLTKLLKSFSEHQQYEILRCMFDKEKYYDDDYDTRYLKLYLGVADDICSLLQRYETLIRKTRAYKINEKREVLNELLRKLEPYRDDVKNINKKYDDIFFLGNNLNIRHNNEEGKHKNSYYLNLGNKEISDFYNDLFYLIKIVVNELDDIDFYKCYAEKERIFSKIKEMKNSNSS